jgi:hypothetical protein
MLRTIDIPSVYDGFRKEIIVQKGYRSPVLWTALAIFALSAPVFSQASWAQAPSAAQSAGEAKMGHSSGPVATGPLKISYAGKTEEWTAATLAALPHVTVTVYNEHAKATQTYSGVPLTALLTRLGVPDKPHGKDFRLYLVAEGADGYQVVYSVGEVTPDVHDGTTLVADTVDGKDLAANGPFQLVTTGEKRPARWVRNLAAIRVLSAQ